MTFATAFSKKEPVYMESGSKIMDTYEYSIDEKGHKSLVKTGEKDIYTPIQEALESTLIENILQKAALGDPEALNKVEGQYMDTTNMPTSLAEAQNKIIELKNEFNKLPVEVRREFDFSPEKYIHTFGTNDWAKSMGFIKEENPIKTTEETPKETQKETPKETKTEEGVKK